MKDTNENQQSQHSICEELGIVELDARLDMAFDPLITVAKPATANSCNNNCPPRIYKF